MEKSNNRLQELDSAPLGKLLWKYSLPAVVGIVVMSIYNIIDRIFIGQGVGPDAIAGLAITFPVMNVSAAFGVLIGAGASARTSILLGMQAKDKAEQVLVVFVTFTRFEMSGASLVILYLTSIILPFIGLSWMNF